MFSFVRDNYVNEWSSKNNGMIYIICNNKEIFKIKKHYLKWMLVFLLKDEFGIICCKKSFRSILKKSFRHYPFIDTI
jgi:hypothetical protein